MSERKPRVDPIVPTRAIDMRLGRVNVGTPDETVVSMIREAISRQIHGPEGSKWTPTIQRQTIRYALWRHHENLSQYVWVMGGH